MEAKEETKGPIVSKATTTPSLEIFLQSCELASYHASFIEFGYDDFSSIVRLSPEKFEEMLKTVEMKPGHQEKFRQKVEDYKQSQDRPFSPFRERVRGTLSDIRDRFSEVVGVSARKTKSGEVITPEEEAKWPRLPPFVPDMEIPSTRLIDLSKGKTYYELHGDPNDPLIVCLHGIRAWSFCFTFMAPKLVEHGYRVLVYDFYGRGFSSSPADTVHNPDLYVEQLEELLNGLNITENFVLLGHSLGGCVATYYTNKHPDRVEKLILIAPAVVPIPSPVTTKILQTTVGSPLFMQFGSGSMVKKMKQERLADNVANPDRLPKHLIDEIIERLEWAITKKEGFLEALNSTLNNFPFTDGCLGEVEKLGKHGIDVLLMWGVLDERIPYNLHGLVLAKLRGKAKFESIPHSAHLPFLEQMNITHIKILQFLIPEQQVVSYIETKFSL